jgi:hypothetical protein
LKKDIYVVYIAQMSLSYSSIQTANIPTGVIRDLGSKGVKKIQTLPSNQMLSAKHAGKVFMPTKRILASTYPSTIFSSAQKATSLIPSIDFIEEILLKIDVAIASAPLQLVPTAYWIRQKDLRDSSSGTVIQTAYDDTDNANLLNRVTAGREKAIFKTNNIESNSIGKLGLTKPLPVGTHTFYIPLLTSVFENFGGLYLADMVGDLALDLTTPSTIIASGAGTLTATISFVVSGAKLMEEDIAIYRNRYKMNAVECQFLEPLRTEFYNVTMTAASSNNLFKLNNVDGLCAYQMMLFRPTGTIGQNANFAAWKLLNIGDYNGAGLDLVSSSGESKWGLGSHVPTRYIRQHMSVDNFDNDWVSQKPVYFLNYSDNMNTALRGVVNGGYRFRATDGDQIRVNLPAAPINEVQTVTFTATPAVGGFYSFNFRGEESAQILASSSVAVMKATFEAMRGVASRFLTVTFSAAASAGASFTITFVDPEGTLTDGDVVNIISHDGMVAGASTARTVAGVPGLATGNYDVFVYSYLYNLAAYSNGKLTSQLL